MLPNLSKSIKAILYLIGSLALGYILTFPFRLLDDAIQEFVRDYITKKFAVPLTTFIIYATSFAAAALIIWGAYKTGGLRKEKPRESRERSEAPSLSEILTEMHKRMMCLKTARLKQGFDNKRFENALPALMDRLGLVELDKWDNFEHSIRRRIRRATGKKRTGNAYFKAIREACKIKQELSQSQNWTIDDALKIGEWLDGYDWGLGKLRGNDVQWKALWESINPYLLDDKLRELIEQHINLSYACSSASLIVDYSRKQQASIRFSVLYEALVGGPISPVKIDLALSEILAKIDKQTSVLGEKEKELVIPCPSSLTKPPAIDKLSFVVQKIVEAKQIIPKGNDAIVYLSKFQNIINAEELHNILLKLQNDEKVLTIKYYPNHLLPRFPFTYTKDMVNQDILDAIDPARQQFRVETNDRFDGFAKQLG